MVFYLNENTHLMFKKQVRGFEFQFINFFVEFTSSDVVRKLRKKKEKIHELLKICGQ